MKIALIKLGSRISCSSQGTSGGTGEALAIIKLLYIAGANVDVYTKILDGDEKPDYFSIYNIEDEYKNINNRNYDCLLIMNGSVNYFGGVDSPSQTLNYYIINNFTGKVYYIMCDCNLLLKQLWPVIENKSWSSNYNKEDIYIKRDDIVYISQARYVDKVLEKARAQDIHIKDVIYYPLEKFPFITMDYLLFNSNPSYDILYGGTFRNGRREDDLIKFYFGYSKEKVALFGKIELDNFNQKKIANLTKPDFEKSVSYDKFANKMLEAKSTIIIGDKLYKQWGDLAQRIYESILVGNVVFIDSSYDFSKRVFKNEELRQFNYVSNRDEVKYKLKKLDDSDFRKHIVDLQKKDTYINKIDYCKDFLKLFEV